MRWNERYKEGFRGKLDVWWAEWSSNGCPEVCVCCLCVFADPFIVLYKLSWDSFSIPLQLSRTDRGLVYMSLVHKHAQTSLTFTSIHLFLCLPYKDICQSSFSCRRSDQGSAKVISSPTLTRDLFIMICGHTQEYLYKMCFWIFFCCWKFLSVDPWYLLLLILLQFQTNDCCCCQRDEAKFSCTRGPFSVTIYLSHGVY